MPYKLWASPVGVTSPYQPFFSKKLSDGRRGTRGSLPGTAMQTLWFLYKGHYLWCWNQNLQNFNRAFWKLSVWFYFKSYLVKFCLKNRWALCDNWSYLCWNIIWYVQYTKFTLLQVKQLHIHWKRLLTWGMR